MKKALAKWSAEVLLALILGLRPLLGPASCVYTISCTDFARFQLEQQPLQSALWAIIKRLACCHPLALRFRKP